MLPPYVTYLARREIHRRWRTAALLALLTSLVVATVFTAAAGARRTRSAFDRMLARYRPLDVAVFGHGAPIPDGLRSLPGAVDVARSDVYAALPKGIGPDQFWPMAVSLDGKIPGRYMRPRVLRGRLPSPAQPHEIAISEAAARRLRLDVGGQLPMVSMTPEQAVEMQQQSGDAGEPRGPSFMLDVVGVTREPQGVLARDRDILLTWLTPAFAQRYHDQIGLLDTAAFVRLDRQASRGAFGAAVRERYPELSIDPTLDVRELRRQVNPTTSVMATALWLFALAAGIAGAAAIAEGVARSAQISAIDDAALAAIGCGRPARTLRAAAPPVVGIIAGTAGGAATSVALSPLLPMGLARRADPHRGFAFDPALVLMGGLVALAVLVGLALAVTAGSLRWSHRRARRPRPNRATSAAAQSGAPVAVVTGLLFAFRRGGRDGVPVRLAVTGIVAGTVGVIAAVVFASSTARMFDNPRLYGWGWDGALSGSATSGLPDASALASELALDRDVARVANVVDQIETDVRGESEYASAIEDVKGVLRPVILSGRAPETPDEIVVGRDTSRRLHLLTGETVPLSTQGAPAATFHVVGIASFPAPEDGGSSAVGIGMTVAGARRMGWTACGDTTTCYRNVVFTTVSGVPVTRIRDRYRTADRDLLLPRPPAEVERLREVQRLPWLLAGFLAALATIAVLHTVVTTVRRRYHDLGVLRTLGFTARQLRAVITVQAASLVFVGGAVGVVGGLLAGRQAWRLQVRSLALPYSPSVPVLGLLVVPLVTLALAEAAAVVPRRTAAKIVPAAALRAE